jgi:CDP-glycerol glycerophosphotransferase (TagB/SpsB family)
MAVLRAFKQQNRYNLIFAPHVMLFARRWVLTVDKLSLAAVRKPDPQLLQASNIHADLGSSASNDMSYTNSADIYLGDVSSQIYEFLYRPRPCLFLNSHNVDWQDQASYLHWRAGPVIDSPNAIIAAVDDAVARHADYTAVQRTLLDSTFSVSEIPAPIRAAKAINDFLAKRQTT